MLLLTAAPVHADNCSGLSDCSTTAKVGIAAAAALALGLLLAFALPGLLAAGTTGAAVSTLATEEIGAAAAISGADAAGLEAAATGGAVSVESVIAQGALRAGGRLAGVLSAIETAVGAAAPTTALEGLEAVGTATASVGLEPGVVMGTTAGGSLVIENVGGVVTYLFHNGQILVMRGAQILLHLIP
jgi:hypothetical protein